MSTLQTTSVAPTLVEAFAQEIEATVPRRRSLILAEYAKAFIRSAPHLAAAPERDALLLAALEQLAHREVIHASKRRDERGLPSRIRLLARRDVAAVGSLVAGYPWRPEVSFVVREQLHLRRSEFESLKAIQAFFRDAAPDAPLVPVPERSLQLFGNEKRLDSLLRSRLFGWGRLGLAQLRAYPCAPPFVYQRFSDSPVALVLENAATYRSVCATLPRDSVVGLVVFGAGQGFASTVAYFSDLMAMGERIYAIRYFGDLDSEGLRIPVAAASRALGLGLPPVLPAPQLWRMLLRLARPARHPKIAPALAASVTAWLPEDIRVPAERYLVAGERLAQEAVGTEVLRADPSWATPEALGVDVSATATRS